MFRKFIFLLLILCLTATTCLANSMSASYGATDKLGRGLGNILGGPLEIVKRPCVEIEQHGLPRGAFIGVVGGFFDVVTRIVVGAFELVTVPFPLGPGFSYQPIVYPDYVWDDWYEPLDFEPKR